jgi:hypothetical protein
MIRGADVESGQHLPTPPLEAGLSIARTIRDVSRVNTRLILVSGDLQELRLR